MALPLYHNQGINPEKAKINKFKQKIYIVLCILIHIIS